jgi:phosphotriesterase-related protein
LRLQQYYPPNHWGGSVAEEEMVGLFVVDIEEGIDANDYGEPFVRRTAHRAGVIKVAGGRDRLSEHERKCFRAAGRAQSLTGCPILTHTEQGTAGEEQTAVLQEAGADLAHVVLSHTHQLPDIEYHHRLPATGVTLEYDSAFRGTSSRSRASRPSGSGF